jgi:PPOX class probable F420-dependent enzyme
MRTNLAASDVADLLEEPLVAVLATRRPDDAILLSPVWFEWRDGGFNVWAAANDKGKVRHIERDPRVSIVVANSDWPYKGIEVRGEARLSPDGFFDVLGRTARRYFGEEVGGVRLVVHGVGRRDPDRAG